MKEALALENLETVVGRLVFPGDVFTVDSQGKKTIIGKGMTLLPRKTADKFLFDKVLITRIGILRQISVQPSRFFVESSVKRYIPTVNDELVGVVVGKFGMTYKVEINAPRYGYLDFLAFHGATKRNRPNLRIGAVVYCKVVEADRNLNPVLSCKSDIFKKEWMSGEAFYTELKKGFTFKVSVAYAFELRKKDNFCLNYLGSKIGFEIVVGSNGRIWINAGTVKMTILAVNSIKAAEGKPQSKVTRMIDSLLQFFIT